MIIICRNKNIVNLAQVSNIFKGNDGLSIKVNFVNGQGTQLEKYNSVDEADVALEMLGNAIGKNEKFLMPNEEQIQAFIISKRSAGKEYHNQHKGVKKKRHGGS